MSEALIDFKPLVAQPGVPLRVAMYSQLAQAIRGGDLPAGSLVPTEIELGAAMKVSRTVVREALMLLEEDGLIRSRRGVGRFVAEALPPIGLERITPLEDVFASFGRPVTIDRVRASAEPASEFVAPGIGVAVGQPALFWESVIRRDGEPIAQLQESLALLPSGLDQQDAESRTMLGALLRHPGLPLGPGQCEITAGIAGPSRAPLLELGESDPVLVLTQYVRRAGRAYYLAKCLVAPRAGHFSVAQAFRS